MWLLPALSAIALVAAAQPPARAVAPTCETLVSALPAALASSREVVIAVTLEQGGREVAFERSRRIGRRMWGAARRAHGIR